MGENRIVKTVEREVEVTESLYCDNCGATIPFVFPGQFDITTQGERALLVKFSGGYGMYIDPLTHPQASGILCHDCADELCKRYPWIDKLLNGVS